MRIELVDIDGSAGLSAEVDDFDGTPSVTVLEVGLPLEGVSPDRLAVGAALAFGRWTAGPLDLPRPFSALTAQRITEYLAGRWVSCGPIRRGGLPIPRGSRVLELATPDAAVSKVPRFIVDSVTSFTGVREAGLDIAVASNAALLAQETSVDGPDHPAEAELAVAVLAAEFFDVGGFLCPAWGVADPSGCARAARLIEAVGLGLGG